MFIEHLLYATFCAKHIISIILSYLYKLERTVFNTFPPGFFFLKNGLC